MCLLAVDRLAGPSPCVAQRGAVTEAVKNSLRSSMVQHGEFCIVDLDAAGWAMPVVVKAIRSSVGDQMMSQVSGLR